MKKQLHLTLLAAVGLVIASTSFAAPPLPMNPGLVDALRPAAPRTEELSVSALEDRLRETKAIPPLQKLALKAEIDELLGRLREAHATGPREVAELREPYEKLLVKIRGLLKKDPQLARDIATSRETIWAVLADRTQFASLY